MMKEPTFNGMGSRVAPGKAAARCLAQPDSHPCADASRTIQEHIEDGGGNV